MIHGRLLVEGTGDKHFLDKLLEHHIPLRNHVRICPRQGLRNLLKVLPTELKAVSTTERLGIVLDADYDISLRWATLREVLIANQYKDVPKLPVADGTIVSTVGKATVGVWLMPDNQSNGMLEDFVRFLVKPNDGVWRLAETAVARVAPHIPCGPHKKSKAVLHTWLAWQDEPGLSLSSAIEERYLDREAKEVKRFLAWLNRLFG